MPDSSAREALYQQVAQSMLDEDPVVLGMLSADELLTLADAAMRPLSAALEAAEQLEQADAIIAANEGKWELRNIMKLAPWFDAALEHHSRRRAAGKKGEA